MSKHFLVKFSATVGRQKTSIAVDDSSASLLPPIELTYFGVVQAKDEEEAASKIVQYGDPGFKTQMLSMNELGDGMSKAELFELMDIDKIITELS